MSYEVPVNRDRSNAMKTTAARVIVRYLEDVYFGIIAAKELAQTERVYDEAMQEAVELVEAESINWFRDVEAMDHVISQGPFAAKLWALTMEAREHAISKKETGYVTDQPKTVPNPDHFFKSRLDTILSGVLYAISNASGNSGMDWIIAPFDNSRTWDTVMLKRAGTPEHGGFGVGGKK